ncbi:hypothetical protein BS78_05G270100 [Paspalum vaginatum]|nr:hypothetical protein BS78_05G270100 [Paspalum vaginatum]
MASPARACLVAVFLALTLLFLELEGSAAAATASARIRSVQERRQVQSLLRKLNKPPLATIQSPDGDIIDCVHISKQLAFDDPLLRDHTIQMQPSYHPRGQHQDSRVMPRQLTQKWHQNGQCPENTIPIRRTREEDILRASSIERFGKKRLRSMPLQADLSVHQCGVAFALGDDKYYGTQATFNLWQPKVEKDEDFSLTQLWIAGGSYDNNDLNTIEVGWQVYPAFYGDNSTRLFIFWTRDAYQTTGCYNLLCSGFVQTNNQIVIGGSISQLSPISFYDGPQYDLTILAWKDPGTGNWWLLVGTYFLGYWPSSIFTNLADSATSVEWGGEVAAFADAGQTSTQMGSGHFPTEEFGKASYIKNIQVVDSTNHLKVPSGLGLIAGQPNCYNVQNGSSSDWGTYIFYGGPGKNPMCQNSFIRNKYPLPEAM